MTEIVLKREELDASAVPVAGALGGILFGIGLGLVLVWLHRTAGQGKTKPDRAPLVQRVSWGD